MSKLHLYSIGVSISTFKLSNLGVTAVSAVDNVCLTSNVVAVSVKLRILLPLVAVCQVEPPSTEVSIVVVVKSDNQLAPFIVPSLVPT